MKHCKTNSISILVVSVGVLVMIMNTGCWQKKKLKPVNLEMTVFVNSVPAKKDENFLTNLRHTMDPYLCLSQDRKNESAILIRPQKTQVLRLDCSGGGSAFNLHQWKSFWLGITERFGLPRIKRYKNDWEKNALSKITMETISGLCPKGEIKPADYSRVSVSLETFKYFYVMSQHPDQLMSYIGQSFGGQNLIIVKNPEDIWKDLYQKLTKALPASLVRIGILYDSGGGPVPSYQQVMESLHNGDYQKAMDKLREALKVTEDEQLKELNEKLNNKLKVDIVLRYLKDGKAVTATRIDPKLTLSSDTPYSISLKPSSNCYLYVFQVDSADKVDIVFPNAEYSTKQSPTPSSSLRIPEKHERWFKLDKTTGIESIYVLAVPFKNQYLDKLVKARDQKGILTYLARLRKSKPVAPGIVFDEYTFTHS